MLYFVLRVSDHAKRMRSLLPISLLPLLAVGGQHLVERWVLAPALRDARQGYVVLGRAVQVDLALQLERARRRAVLGQMARELRQAGDVPGAAALAVALERCAAERGRCPSAHDRSKAAAWSGRKRVWRVTGVRVGVAILTGLMLAVCGGLVVRRVWGRRRLALGLALAGALLGLGGAARQVQGALRDAHLVWRESTRDVWITRSRLALWLPAGQQRAELERGAAALQELGLDGASELSRLVARCKGRCPPARVLPALARIYGQPVGPSRPSWLDRWLLWIGATLLLLVPAARARP